MPRGWSLLGPLTWSTYVSKQVMVTLPDKQELRGWLQTVDPVSASVVLVNFRDGGGALVRLVMGHAVEELQVLQEPDQQTRSRLRSVFLPPAEPRSPGELSRRRSSLRAWLVKNQVPVEEEGEELRVAGALTIGPPYGPDDCCSSNQIILDRVRRLIQNLEEKASRAQQPPA